jgi:hypothetical protein
MSQPESKTVPFAPSSPTLGNFLDRNHQFASTCDPEVLATTCKGQSPSVFWLGCSDSRVPEGVVIQAGLGEVFVHVSILLIFFFTGQKGEEKKCSRSYGQHSSKIDF